MLIRIIPLLCLLAACSHPPQNTKLGDAWNPPTRTRYKKELRKFTKKHQEYRGLKLVFEADVTFLSKPLQDMQLLLKAHFKNLSTTEAEAAVLELKEKNSTQSYFFMSFFTPNPRNNKVDKDFADWSAVLITDTQEINGSISLHENEVDHVKILYPTVHPWAKTYMITFPISTEEIQKENFKFKIMGPTGMGIVKFKRS